MTHGDGGWGWGGVEGGGGVEDAFLQAKRLSEVYLRPCLRPASALRKQPHLWLPLSIV